MQRIERPSKKCGLFLLLATPCGSSSSMCSAGVGDSRGGTLQLCWGGGRGTAELAGRFQHPTAEGLYRQGCRNVGAKGVRESVGLSNLASLADFENGCP